MKIVRTKSGDPWRSGSAHIRWILPSLALLTLSILPAADGQVQDAPAASETAPTASAPPAAAPQNKAPGITPSSTFLGKDVPAFDPGSDMFMWDGKGWNATNNRIFQARFEKYLNAPEATSAED